MSVDQTQRRFERDQQVSVLDALSPFVGSVSADEVFTVETSVGSRVPTGPLEVRGARPGDVVRVDIVDVTLHGDGWVWSRPGAGVVGERLFDHIKERRARPIEIRGDVGVFSPEILVPLAPMVGVVGVAPPGPGLPSYWPGRHGGNLDFNGIRAGSSVYLPVYADGVGLVIGDIHARMGSGEVMTSGLEIEGEVTARVEVFPATFLDGPVVEDAAAVTFLASAKSLDQAAELVVARGIAAIQAATGLDFVDAGMLASLVGDLGVAQAVNPRVTASFRIAKSDLPIDALSRGSISP
jgi:amidase